MVPDQRELIERRDWDNIILFDACRFDFFEELYPEFFEGELRKVYNGGIVSTYYWFENIFTDVYDCCLYTPVPVVFAQKEGTPWAEDESKNWKYPDGFRDMANHTHINWDDEIDAVTPEKINEAVREYETDASRKLIRYLTPHLPHIGEYAVKYARKSDEFSTISRRVKNAVNDGEITLEQLKKSYEENVRIAFQGAINLMNDLEGKTIITADHGDCLGNCGLFGHSNSDMENHDHMVYVPWFEVESPLMDEVKYTYYE